VSEAEIIQIARGHLESLFPKECPNCGRRYATLKEYIRDTTRIGATRSYDAETGDWNTKDPIGMVAAANCACGNTLTLTSEGMPLELELQVLKWLRAEGERRGLNASQLLDLMRDKLRDQLVGNAEGKT